MKANTAQAGFTLTELLVTVTIVGIFSGMSIVTFSKNWRDERVKAAARETTGWLEEAQKIALQTSTPCRVTVDRATATLTIDPDAGDSYTYCNEDELQPLSLRSIVQNAGDLQICTATITMSDPASYALPCIGEQSGSTSLRFTPRGTAIDGTLIKLHLEQANTDRCIAVMSPLGQIRSGRATTSGCDFTTAF